MGSLIGCNDLALCRLRLCTQKCTQVQTSLLTWKSNWCSDRDSELHPETNSVGYLVLMASYAGIKFFELLFWILYALQAYSSSVCHSALLLVQSLMSFCIRDDSHLLSLKKKEVWALVFNFFCVFLVFLIVHCAHILSSFLLKIAYASLSTSQLTDWEEEKKRKKNNLSGIFCILVRVPQFKERVGNQKLRSLGLKFHGHPISWQWLWVIMSSFHPIYCKHWTTCME